MISPQYIHMVPPIPRFLLSRHMLLPYGHFCALHGRCFQVIYECAIIYSNNRHPLAAPHFPTRSRPLGQFLRLRISLKFAGADDDEDIFYYDISRDDFQVTFVFYGIDTSANCDTSSNLDFVRFIWLNYECFNFVKYSMTFVRRDCPSLPELVRLKYYRAKSNGWRDNVHCGSCVGRYQHTLRHMTRCLRPNDCSCTICRRQPTSLFSSASNALFQLVLELERFALTSETT